MVPDSCFWLNVQLSFKLKKHVFILYYTNGSSQEGRVSSESVCMLEWCIVLPIKKMVLRQRILVTQRFRCFFKLAWEYGGIFESWPRGLGQQVILFRSDFFGTDGGSPKCRALCCKWYRNKAKLILIRWTFHSAHLVQNKQDQISTASQYKKKWTY